MNAQVFGGSMIADCHEKLHEQLQVRREEIQKADGQVFCKLGGTHETSKKCSDIVRNHNAAKFQVL